MRIGLRARGQAAALPLVLALAVPLAAGLVAGCSPSVALTSNGKIVAVGAENQYANVIQHVGGKYVQASAVMSNPNTDPHTFEASASVGRLVNAAHFIQSLTAWKNAMAAFKATYPNTPVATTEPVADYMLQAVGADNLTPFAFQADIMNGTDPSAQDVAVERNLFTQHKVKVFLYNQQVTDTLTESLITLAHQNGIPVVGVYETMPVPGYDYQSWMLTEVQDLQKAVVDHVSTEHL
jgi:ABC-type Zn uptake system ZnuABC Zn-binding protein ZnuA